MTSQSTGREVPIPCDILELSARHFCLLEPDHSFRSLCNLSFCRCSLDSCNRGWYFIACLAVSWFCIPAVFAPSLPSLAHLAVPVTLAKRSISPDTYACFAFSSSRSLHSRSNPTALGTPCDRRMPRRRKLSTYAPSVPFPFISANTESGPTPQRYFFPRPVLSRSSSKIARVTWRTLPSRVSCPSTRRGPRRRLLPP